MRTIRYSDREEYLVTGKTLTAVQPFMILAMIDNLSTWVYYLVDLESCIHSTEIMKFLNESRHSEEQLAKTTKKADGKKWLGHDIDRFRKLGYNIVMFKQVLYLLYEDLAIALRGFVDRLTTFIRSHQFGSEHEDLLAELIEYAVEYMCMEFNVIFRNIRSMNIFSVQKFLSDVNSLPVITDGGYLMEKYNELSMVRSLKSNSSLVSMIDGKKKKGKGNGNGPPGKSNDGDKSRNSKGSNDSPTSDILSKSEKRDKSQKQKNNSLNTPKSGSMSDSKEDQRNMCVAFNTEEGCKYGDECTFVHDDPKTDGEKRFIRRFLGKRTLRSGVSLD